MCEYSYIRQDDGTLTRRPACGRERVAAVTTYRPFRLAAVAPSDEKTCTVLHKPRPRPGSRPSVRNVHVFLTLLHYSALNNRTVYVSVYIRAFAEGLYYTGEFLETIRISGNVRVPKLTFINSVQ